MSNLTHDTANHDFANHDSATLLMPCGQARGQIRHRRFRPKKHEFHNQLHYLWLDADQLGQTCAKSCLWSFDGSNQAAFSLARFNLLRINPADLLGQGRVPLRDAIVKQVQQQLGKPVLASDHIRLLTLPHSLGFGFNSVSFYFVFRGMQPLFILSEITNTPWNERYTYVLDCDSVRQYDAHGVAKDTYIFEFDKQFHVSPFMPMQAQYRWHFKISADQFVIYMQMQQQEKQLFDARLSFALQALNPRQQTLFAIKHPLQGVKMLSGIYWQALRLAIKKIPFYRHPKTTAVGENQR